MSTIEKTTETLDKIQAMLSDGVFEGKTKIRSAKQLSEALQRRYDAMPEDDKKTLKKRVNSSLANLKNILKKPDKPNLKNRANGGQINGLKKMGMNKGGLAGRLAQRGYGKARS